MVKNLQVEKTRLVVSFYYLSELNVSGISDAGAVRLFVASILNQLSIPNTEVLMCSFSLWEHSYSGPATTKLKDQRNSYPKCSNKEDKVATSNNYSYFKVNLANRSYQMYSRIRL